MKTRRSIRENVPYIKLEKSLKKRACTNNEVRFRRENDQAGKNIP